MRSFSQSMHSLGTFIDTSRPPSDNIDDTPVCLQALLTDHSSTQKTFLQDSLEIAEENSSGFLKVMFLR